MKHADLISRSKERSSRRLMQQAFGLTLIVLLLAGCSGASVKPTATLTPVPPTATPMPSLLSDEEFAETAQGTCQTLMTEITSLNQFDYAGKAEAYRLAAGVLTEFEVSEESAPQGILLRNGLIELAEAQENLAGALDKALAVADMDTLGMLITTEEIVFASASYPLGDDIVILDLDSALIFEVNTKIDAVRGAATALGLEECAPEQLENDE